MYNNREILGSPITTDDVSQYRLGYAGQFKEIFNSVTYNSKIKKYVGFILLGTLLVYARFKIKRYIKLYPEELI